jgi:hypothetical protein
MTAETPHPPLLRGAAARRRRQSSAGYDRCGRGSRRPIAETGGQGSARRQRRQRRRCAAHRDRNRRSLSRRSRAACGPCADDRHLGADRRRQRLRLRAYFFAPAPRPRPARRHLHRDFDLRPLAQRAGGFARGARDGNRDGRVYRPEGRRPGRALRSSRRRAVGRDRIDPADSHHRRTRYLRDRGNRDVRRQVALRRGAAFKPAASQSPLRLRSRRAACRRDRY